ncbi:MAG: hypothetical protein NC337_09305 [Roseburia sp.]|nr:hypothetical protein [Roseburia sp.]
MKGQTEGLHVNRDASVFKNVGQEIGRMKVSGKTYGIYANTGGQRSIAVVIVAVADEGRGAKRIEGTGSGGCSLWWQSIKKKARVLWRKKEL